MKKKMIAGIITAAMALSMSMTAFAGQWQSDANGWWYQNDGVAESYCFDGNGYCLMNTTTPDGYTVNPAGAWVVNGVVQTQQVTNTQVQAANLVDLEPITSSEYSIVTDARTTKNKLWSKAICLGNSSSYTTKAEYFVGGTYSQLYLCNALS